MATSPILTFVNDFTVLKGPLFLLPVGAAGNSSRGNDRSAQCELGCRRLTQTAQLKNTPWLEVFVPRYRK